MSALSRWRRSLAERLPRPGNPLGDLTVVLRSTGDPAQDDVRRRRTAAGVGRCVLSPAATIEVPDGVEGPVVFVEPEDELQLDALAGLVRQLRAAGAEAGRGAVAHRAAGVVLRRTPPGAAGGPGGSVDPRQHPGVLALVDLRGLVVSGSAWRAAATAPVPWDGPALAGTRALLGAGTVVVSTEVVVVTEESGDVDLPVEERRRHRPDRCAAACRGVEAASAGLPAELRTPHAAALVGGVLGDVVTDALAGRATALPEVARLAGVLVGHLGEPGARADLTVESRLRARVAADGTLADVRAAASFLLQHPRGLPHHDGVVVGAGGWLDAVPEEWRRLERADRRLQVRLLEPREDDGTWRLRGNALVTAVPEAPDRLPRVEVDGVALTVTPRPDPSADVWAAREHEDHADCGFEATVAAGRLGDVPPGGRRVTVSLHGLSRTLGLPAPTPAADVVLTGADLAPEELRLVGRGPVRDAPLEVRLVGPVVETGWAPVAPGDDGSFSVTVGLTTPLFSHDVLLPAGRYAVEARARGTLDTLAVAWAADLAEPGTEWVGERLALHPAPGALVVGPPVALRDDSARSRRLRMNVWTPRSVEALRRTVVLESFAGRSVADNPLAVGRELARRDLDADLVWLVDDPSVRVPEGTRAVPRRTPEMFKVLAGAAAYVSNASAPDWWRKRPGMVHVQTWHGVPLKRIGEDRGPGDLATWRHREVVASQAAGWDLLVSPSPWCSPVFRSAFRFGGTLLEAGQPRNDVLLGPHRDAVGARVRAELGLTSEERVVLYAPTWRDNAGHRVAKPVHLDVAAFLEGSPGTTLLVRGHYNASRQRDLRHEGRVVDVTRYPDAADLLCAADALVTDYSSVMFDFCLTGRPIVLLVPDLETYRDVHPGTYFDIAERAPGPVVRDTPGVLAALARPGDADAQARADFRAAFCPLDDGGASARVVDRLVDLLGW
ncbi:hypothetical protein GCM10027596_21080 [Nocardioides korecus]